MNPLLHVPRISAADVLARMQAGEPVVLIDARSDEAFAKSSRRVPGAIRIPPQRVEEHLADVPRGVPLVAFCT